jgi:TRAP transporter TAXI family solute receptor
VREPARWRGPAAATALALAVAFTTATARAQLAEPSAITVATAAPGAVYHAVGNAICRLVNLTPRDENRPCVARLSEGSIENLERIRTGKADIAVAQEDVVAAAYKGIGPFQAIGAEPRLRLIMSLHPELFIVAARTSAKTVDELRGLRINFGRPGAGYALTRERLLEALGWTAADVALARDLGPAEQNTALCAGDVDAIVFMAGQPNGYVQDATLRCGAKLVPIRGAAVERLIARYPEYEAGVVIGGLYPGNPDSIPTLASRAVLLASDALSGDEVHRVVKAVLERFDDFRRLHPALAELRRDAVVPRGSGVPIHPGADRYYREAGLTGR